jgi:hypothetical protein
MRPGGLRLFRGEIPWQNARALATTFPKTCRCGHDRSNPLVHPEPKYSFGGWLMLMLGATPTPKRAEFRCSRCQQVLGVTRDPKILKEFS